MRNVVFILAMNSSAILCLDCFLGGLRDSNTPESVLSGLSTTYRHGGKTEIQMQLEVVVRLSKTIHYT